MLDDSVFRAWNFEIVYHSLMWELGREMKSPNCLRKLSTFRSNRICRDAEFYRMQYFAWGMSCCALMVEHYLELYYLKSLGV